MNLHLTEDDFDYRQYRMLMGISQTRTLQRLRRIALADQGGRCVYCFERLTQSTATADHIKPLIEGGRTVRENIVAACRNCNMAKMGTAYSVFVALIDAATPPAISEDGGPWVSLAWMRRRLNACLEKAERRICRAVGMATL